MSVKFQTNKMNPTSDSITAAKIASLLQPSSKNDDWNRNERYSVALFLLGTSFSEEQKIQELWNHYALLQEFTFVVLQDNSYMMDFVAVRIFPKLIQMNKENTNCAIAGKGLIISTLWEFLSQRKRQPRVQSIDLHVWECWLLYNCAFLDSTEAHAGFLEYKCWEHIMESETSEENNAMPSTVDGMWELLFQRTSDTEHQDWDAVTSAGYTYYFTQLIKKSNVTASHEKLLQVWKEILEWWGEIRTNSDEETIKKRQYWTHTLLSLTLLLCRTGKQSLSKAIVDHLLEKQASFFLFQVLMTCMVSPTPEHRHSTGSTTHRDSLSLRNLAWSTANAFIDTFGWEWILSTSTTDSSSLGRANNLCILVRMASGELKIQLEGDHHHRQNDQLSNLNDILIACAQILHQNILYLIDCETSLSPDAILHIRESLWACQQYVTEYYTLLPRIDNDDASSFRRQCQIEIDDVLIPLWTRLWMEQEEEDEASIPPEMLNHFWSTESRNAQQAFLEILLIVMVLNDDTSLFQKNESKVLHFICQIFRKGDWELIQHACHFIDQIMTLHAKCDMSVIGHAMLEWIEHVLEEQRTKAPQSPQFLLGQQQELAQVLSSCLGLYVEIHYPKDISSRASGILQQAVDFCASIERTDDA